MVQGMMTHCAHNKKNYLQYKVAKDKLICEIYFAALPCSVQLAPTMCRADVNFIVPRRPFILQPVVNSDNNLSHLLMNIDNKC